MSAAAAGPFPAAPRGFRFPFRPVVTPHSSRPPPSSLPSSYQPQRPLPPPASAHLFHLLLQPLPLPPPSLPPCSCSYILPILSLPPSASVTPGGDRGPGIAQAPPLARSFRPCPCSAAASRPYAGARPCSMPTVLSLPVLSPLPRAVCFVAAVTTLGAGGGCPGAFCHACVAALRSQWGVACAACERAGKYTASRAWQPGCCVCGPGVPCTFRPIGVSLSMWSFWVCRVLCVSVLAVVVLFSAGCVPGVALPVCVGGLVCCFVVFPGFLLLCLLLPSVPALRLFVTQ